MTTVLLLIVRFTIIGIWFPGVAAFVCILTSASLVGEGTGRLAMFRTPVPKSPSYNLVVPGSLESAHGTLVLAVPLDVPMWRMSKPSWIRRPLKMVFISAMLISVLLLLRGMSEPFGVATISLYSGALAVMAISTLIGIVAARRVGDGRGDGGGAAVALELIRRLRAAPTKGVSVWTVFTGCGRAHQDGVRAFLSLRGDRLPEPVLVVALQDPAQSPLQAVVTEGPLWEQHHRPTGPALVERLRWAGLRVPAIDRAEPTDARGAMILGYRAVAFAGGAGQGSAKQALESADVIETVVRWYDQDLCRLAVDRSGLEDLAMRTQRPSGGAKLVDAPAPTE